MSAQIMKGGFSTVGFNDDGELAVHDVSLILAEVPSVHGEWMFVLIDESVHWVHGLESGKGYELYNGTMLQGHDKKTWNEQIQTFVQKGYDHLGPDDCQIVSAGSSMNLSDKNILCAY